jgi:hypothetical protein
MLPASVIGVILYAVFLQLKAELEIVSSIINPFI